MSNPRGIREDGQDVYTVDFSKYLPEPLKRDQKMKAFAAAVTEQMLAVSGNIDNVLIYSRIDELPEELVDILAYDMHVDWYDYSFPLEVKRAILRNSVKIHKKMGTKYAVETALKDIYKSVTVKEWFEYGGMPYRFRIIVDIGNTGLTEGTSKKIEDAVKFYKNLRSHCDSIQYKLSSVETIVKIKSHARMGTVLKVKPYLEKELNVEENAITLPGLAVGETIKIKAGLPDLVKSERNKY